MKLVFDTAQTFFNDGKLPNNNYGLLNLYATQKEKFNELIKKLTWENTKSVLLQILSPLGLGILFILSCIFEGGKIVGSAIGKFLIQIGGLIKSAGTSIINSFKETGFIGSRLKVIGDFFIECGKFLSRKTEELLFKIDELLPKIDDDGNPITETSKRWERAFELSGRNIVSALNFTSETLQNVLPTTKYVTNADGTLKMKDDGTGPETQDIDENNYEERRAELCRRIGRGLNTAYDTTGKVITDIRTVLRRGASSIYDAGITIAGIPQIIVEKLKELLPSQTVDGTGEFDGNEIELVNKNEEFRERINVLKIRISKGKATSSEILAGSLLCPVGTFGAYMSILLNKLNEAIAYISTSAGIENVFSGIWLETGKVIQKNIRSQFEIMKKSFTKEELTADDKATLNSVGIKSINDLNDKLWKNLTYTRDLAEIGDFASKSDPFSDIVSAGKDIMSSLDALRINLSQASLNIFNEAKRLFGIGFNNVVEFGNQVIKSMGQGVCFLWSIAKNNVYYGGKIVVFGIVGIIGTSLAIMTNAVGVVVYCFTKIVEKGLYTLKTSLIILAAILNPATQIGKYPVKVVIWIFKLGFNIITLGLVRKYYKDLAKKIADANLDQPLTQSEENTCRDALQTIMKHLPEKEQRKRFKDLGQAYKNILIARLKTDGFTDEQIQKCIETEIDMPPPPPAQPQRQVPVNHLDDLNPFEQVPVNHLDDLNPFERSNAPKQANAPAAQLPPPPAQPQQQVPVNQFDDDNPFERSNAPKQANAPAAPLPLPPAQPQRQVVGPNNVQVQPMGGGSRKNHLTRRQWTRSKPSRFKTHRIY